MGRRSPGRRGGRAAAVGRGRWKMGCPRTGRPGTARSPAAGGALAGALGGRTGARYTGRGPVCGRITRRGASAGVAVAGGAAAATGGGADGLVGESAAGGVAATGAVGGAIGRLTIGAPGVKAGAVATRAIGAAGVPATGAAAGLPGTVSAAGFTPVLAAGAGGAASAWTVCRVMAFRTSPGLEIPLRSILVLISPGSGRALLAAARAALSEAAVASARKCSRTRTASSGSMELECDFLPATPAWSK